MECSSAIHIRQFVRSDLVPLHRMIQKTIEASYQNVYPARAIQFFREFHAETEIVERSRAGEILVLEEGGTIAATGALTGNKIYGVFVTPVAQRRGYGKAIMEALEGMAKTKGIKEIHLSISLPSREFYESLGYEVFDVQWLDVGEGKRLEYWPARKKLNEDNRRRR